MAILQEEFNTGRSKLTVVPAGALGVLVGVSGIAILISRLRISGGMLILSIFGSLALLLVISRFLQPYVGRLPRMEVLNDFLSGLCLSFFVLPTAIIYAGWALDFFARLPGGNINWIPPILVVVGWLHTGSRKRINGSMAGPRFFSESLRRSR